MRHDDPARLAVPPPMDITLDDEHRRVGWVNGDSVVFTGFRDEAEAAQAAWVAHRALMQHIVTSFGSRSAPLKAERLMVVRDEQGGTVRADGRPIARVLAPAADARIEAGQLAISLRLPTPFDEQAIRDAAWSLYRELRASGARWGIFPTVAATTRTVDVGRAPAWGVGMRLGVIAILALLVALVQPMLAPESGIRVPLFVFATAALGAAGVSEVLRRMRPAT